MFQDMDLNFQEIIGKPFHTTKLQVLNVEVTTSRLFGIFIERVCSKQLNQSNEDCMFLSSRKEKAGRYFVAMILPSGHKVCTRVGWRISEKNKK